MATKKRKRKNKGGRRGSGGGGGAMSNMRQGFRNAAGRGGRRKQDRTLVYIFWGMLALALLMFALSFVRP